MYSMMLWWPNESMLGGYLVSSWQLCLCTYYSYDSEWRVLSLRGVGVYAVLFTHHILDRIWNIVFKPGHHIMQKIYYC